MRRVLSLLIVFGLPLLSMACRAEGVAPANSAAPGAPKAPAVERRSGALTPDIESVLTAIKAADSGQLSVSPEDGRFLRMLVAATGARSVLEIGAASGYSGIWLGLGVRESGGSVVAVEYDAARAQQAADNIRRAGLSDVVTVIHGDAFSEIPKLSRSFDFVFLDAWKPDYLKFFEMVFPRLEKGGLFVAHNVVNKQSEMGDFLQTIQTHREFLRPSCRRRARGCLCVPRLLRGLGGRCRGRGSGRFDGGLERRHGGRQVGRGRRCVVVGRHDDTATDSRQDDLLAPEQAAVRMRGAVDARVDDRAGEQRRLLRRQRARRHAEVALRAPPRRPRCRRPTQSG